MTRATIVDTQAAGIAVRRTPATIRSWIHRGKLKPYGKDAIGRTLVDLAQVYRVAAETTTKGNA